MEEDGNTHSATAFFESPQTEWYRDSNLLSDHCLHADCFVDRLQADEADVLK